MEIKLGYAEIVRCIEYAMIHDEQAPLRVSGKVQIEIDRRSVQAYIRTGSHVKGEATNDSSDGLKRYSVECPVCAKEWQTEDRRKTLCSDECRAQSKKITAKKANLKREK